MPSINPTEETTKLYFAQTGTDYELHLDSSDFGLEDFTYRDVLKRYRGVDLPKDRPILLSQFPEIYYNWGITPKMLDQAADFMEFVDEWDRRPWTKLRMPRKAN